MSEGGREWHLSACESSSRRHTRQRSKQYFKMDKFRAVHTCTYGMSGLGSNESVCGSTVAQAMVNFMGARFCGNYCQN